MMPPFGEPVEPISFLDPARMDLQVSARTTGQSLSDIQVPGVPGERMGGVALRESLVVVDRRPPY